MNSSSSFSKVEKALMDEYGPTIGGTNLYRVLGFKTYAAFYRGLQAKTIGVHVFKIEGRKGWFALTTDIASWIIQISKERNDMS